MLLGVLATLVLPTSSLAATGTVDATHKTAAFTGTITDPTQLYDIVGFFNNGTDVHGVESCKQPLCDTHTLTVGADAAQLKLDATSDAYNIDLEIVDPSGHKTEVNSSTATSEQHLTFDAPEAGNWTIKVYGAPQADSFSYDATATYRTAEEVAADPPSNEG
jgi:type 1 fimbria pilin